jgi:hypothetical protein
MSGHRATIIIAASLVLLVGLALGWAFVAPARNELAASPIVEVSDAPTVESSTQLSHLSIATSENFARQKIYVISAYLKNVSGKPLRMAEVKMVFMDYDGKPIHEYVQKILDPNQKPLAPGSEFRFEVRQENLPRNWDYHVPATSITRLGY